MNDTQQPRLDLSRPAMGSGQRNRPLADSYFLRTTLPPGVNIVIIIVATLVAVAFVPEDVSSANALRLPALVIAAALSASLCFRSTQVAKAALDPLNIISAAPVYWLLLDPIQGAYDMPLVSRWSVQGTFVAIGLFAIGVWIAGLGRPSKTPGFVLRASSVTHSVKRLFTIATFAFVLAFLRFAIPSRFDVFVMWNALFQDRWSAPWVRGATGGWDAFLDHLIYFGYVLPALFVLLGRRVGWLNGKTIFTFVYVIIIAVLLSTGGGRRILGIFAGCGFMTWFLSTARPQLRHLVVFVLCCAVLLVVMQLMLIYRGVGIGRALAGNASVELNSPGHLHVDDNFLRTAQLIEIIPEHHHFVTWRYLLWVVARPVPRIIWEGKPMDPGFSLPDYLGAKGVSYSSSIVGELYMAFGFLGCFFGGCFWGRLAVALRAILRSVPSPGSLVLFGAGLFALFVGVRSGIELVLMSYAMLAWIGLVKFYSIRPGTR